MTRTGHFWAAYLLVILAIGHWSEAHRLLEEEKRPAATAGADTETETS